MAGKINPKERCPKMKGNKKRYDATLKKEIAQIYLEGRRSALSLAAELGVHVNTIYKCGEQYHFPSARQDAFSCAFFADYPDFS